MTFINVDGCLRPVSNSVNMKIASSDSALTAFWRFFKDSKAVDDVGRPLVVYHGTTGDFSEFDGDREPWHLARDKGKFFFYGKPGPASEYAEGMGEAYTDGGSNVMPVYIALENPYVIDVEGEPSADWDMAGGRFEREAPAGIDGYIVRGVGFDDEPLIMYVALDPCQIKSAIGNPGTFLQRSQCISDGHRPDLGFDLLSERNPDSLSDGEVKSRRKLRL